MPNRNNGRIAIILGAGASCSEGAPGQGDLFQQYFASPTRREHYAATTEMDRELSTFFLEFFGIDVDNSRYKRFPTFEEALGILELADLREEGFKGFDVSGLYREGGSRVRTLRSYLILLIASVLDESLRREPKHHIALVQSLTRSGEIGCCDFISLNYDILIDNALIPLKGGANGIDLDYGIDFYNFSHLNEWERPNPQHKVNLFKLHGSLNWLYCSVCRNVTLTPKQKSVCYLITEPEKCVCAKCNSLSVPIIIPPTYFKVLSNVYLQEVWREAERALSEASVWVVCGYSFPDADIHIKYLMKRVEVNSPMPRKVVICNGHKTKRSEIATDERHRFQRFFGPLMKVSYKKIGFEEFAAEPSRIIRIP